MAQIDFSNAILSPYNTSPLSSYHYLGFPRAFNEGGGNGFVDSNGNKVANGRYHHIETDKYKHNFRYTGEMISSGNEFYIKEDGAVHWKVSNISFNSGDTFSLKISCNIADGTIQ